MARRSNDHLNSGRERSTANDHKGHTDYLCGAYEAEIRTDTGGRRMRRPNGVSRAPKGCGAMGRHFRQAYYGGGTTVVHRVTGNKAPGGDGICMEFFKKNWNTIKDDMLLMFNQMYSTGIIRDQQKHGIVVCIPKTTAPKTPADYRPITLLNTDYKILARIVANRLRPILAELLHPSQHREREGGGILMR